MYTAYRLPRFIAFAIPMRGNEIREEAARMGLVGVYNPHEG